MVSQRRTRFVFLGNRFNGPVKNIVSSSWVVSTFLFFYFKIETTNFKVFCIVNIVKTPYYIKIVFLVLMHSLRIKLIDELKNVVPRDVFFLFGSMV